MLTETELIEVKNVRSLSYTQQIRDLHDFCKQNNLKLVLVVRRNTRLSRTLQEMEKSGEIIIRGKFR
jgi:hypothetical protein